MLGLLVMNEVIVCERCNGEKEIVVQSYLETFPCPLCANEELENVVEHNVFEEEVLETEYNRDGS